MGRKVRLKKKFLASVDMEFIKYLTKEDDMNYLFSSKKSSQMGLPLAFFAGVGGYVAWKYGIPAELIGDYFIMMGLVVLGHMIAYGLSDASHKKSS
jgi:hypothetical protein